MIVVDTSALRVILNVGPYAAEFLHRLGECRINRISAATRLEAQLVVISQLGVSGLPELELLLSRAQIQPSLDVNHLH